MILKKPPTLNKLESGAQINLKSEFVEVRFEWLGFDGDDCFEDFRVVVIERGSRQGFEFGPCVVRDLRKLARFFSDPTQTTVGGGFRNPDIRQYDVHRKGDDCRLVIDFAEVSLHAEFEIRSPAVHIDEKFLKAYDGQ